MNKLIARTALLLCLLAPVALILSSGLPAYYPAHFTRTGIIDRVDLGQQVIVINDTLMHFSSQTRVHSLNTQFSLLNSLRKGMKVGLAFANNNRGLIDEIWVLPKNYRGRRGFE